MKRLFAHVITAVLVFAATNVHAQSNRQLENPASQTPNSIIIEVPGNPCDVGNCGPSDPGGGGSTPIGGGGGGGSGGGGADDYTTGKEMNFNREVPGCLDEQLFAQETEMAVHSSGSPVGDFIPIYQFNDPLYSGPGWQKWQTMRINRSWSAATQQTIEKRMVIHYMYNTITKQVQQVKFKNSYEYGCKGIKVQ